MQARRARIRTDRASWLLGRLAKPAAARLASEDLPVASSQLDNTTRQMLEQLFGMSGGYVLDFSNASFASFVTICLSFDPYDRYVGSKAVVLRQIWLQETTSDVAKLNLDLLEHWHLGKLATNRDLTAFEERAYADLKSVFDPLTKTASPTDLKFLAKNLGDVDLSTLPTELTSQQIVKTRLVEIELCLAAEAPLAVIFLVGSTLEGLLMEMALAHPNEYTSCEAAPKFRGSPKSIDTWTLAEFITVSRVLGVVGEDVLKHADHVRNFRNYIHPRQQLRENFEPRMVTAQIAQHVLLAALTDLKNVSGFEHQGESE